MTKILMVHGGSMNRGGTESFIMSVIRNLDPKQFQFDVLIHGATPGAYDAELKALGVNLLSVPIKGQDPIGNKKAIKAILNNNDYDVVHAHLNQQNGPVLKMAKQAGIPIRISHSHSTESYSSNKIKQILGNMANKSIAPNATDLFACGQAAGEFLYDGNFTIIPNAIDTDLFLYNEDQRAKIRHQYDIDDETTVYGHVGGLNYIKNHQFLINVFYQVHLQNKNSKLLLVGAGDLLESLQEQVKSLNLEDAVIFAGLQTDVPAYLSAMDVFVFPSLFEGMPYVLLEAQNNGLPIICTNNIDPSVQITDLIQRVDIKDEAAWIQALLTTNHSERQSYDNEVKLSGYDLASLADLMAKVYTGESK